MHQSTGRKAYSLQLLELCVAHRFYIAHKRNKLTHMCKIALQLCAHL